MATPTEIVGVVKLKGGDDFIAEFGRMASDARKRIDNINNGLQEVNKSGNAFSENLNSNIKKFGQVLVATGLVLFARKAMDAANVSEDASAKINQALESTGHAAGVTANELESMASALQKVGVFEDDAIKEAQAMLLTFTKIGREVFPDTTEAVLDMSAALGQDLKGSAIQIGKALNDPIQGLNDLMRAGVRLSEQQENQIGNFVATGDLLSAQKIILDELTVRFGGMNKAMAETSAGGLIKFHNGMNNLLESGGQLVQKVLNPIVKGLQPVVDWLNETSAATKSYIGGIILLITQLKIMTIVFELLIATFPRLAVAMGPAGWILIGVNALAIAFGFFRDRAAELRAELAGLTSEQQRAKLSELKKEFASLSAELASLGILTMLGGGASIALKGRRKRELAELIKITEETIAETAKMSRSVAGAGGGGGILNEDDGPFSEAELDRAKGIGKDMMDWIGVFVAMQKGAQDAQTEIHAKGWLDRTKIYQDGMQQMIETGQRLAEEEEQRIQERNQRILDQAMFIRDAVASIGISIADAFRTGGNVLKAALKSMLLVLVDFIERKLIISKISALLDAAINPFAALKSVVPLAIASGLLQVVKSQIAAMAEGGLVTRPTLALVGERGPEVVAPQANFVEFANQLLGQRNAGFDKLSQRGGRGVSIIQNFSTPLNDRRQARFLADTVLKPTIRKEQKRRGRILNKKVIS